MFTQDPFNIGRDVNSFRAEVQKHLTSTDEINKSVSIFRQVSLCNTILNHTANLNHSSYIRGFIYDTLNSLIAIIKKKRAVSTTELPLNGRACCQNKSQQKLQWGGILIKLFVAKTLTF